MSVRSKFNKLCVLWERNEVSRKKKAQVRGWTKALAAKRELTAAQKQEVIEFYKDMTGRTVSLESHEYFYSRTGVFTREYVPLYFYWTEILPRANKWNLIPAYRNKNIFNILLPIESLPRTFLKNINGFFYFDNEHVSTEEAVSMCRNLGEVVIKPAGESQGHGVRRVTVADGMVQGTEQSFQDLLQSYGRNYLVQEVIRQHEGMSALNPTSVNTIRILTYRSDEEVLLIYSVVRIGRKGSVVDNQCAGGISTTIDEDGRLAKFAFGGYDKDNIAETDSGVVLENYQIPSYDKAVDFVKKLHLKLPYFRLIGWDVAIKEDGSPILIEYNTMPGLSQSAFCSGMGKHTERVIRELWKLPNTRFRY